MLQLLLALEEAYDEAPRIGEALEAVSLTSGLMLARLDLDCRDDVAMSQDNSRVILESTEVASTERCIRIGWNEEVTYLPYHLVDRRWNLGVVRPDRLIELGDQCRDRSDPTEPQVVDGSLQRLARGHPPAEPLHLDALRLQQLAVQLEQRPAQRWNVGHRPSVCRLGARGGPAITALWPLAGHHRPDQRPCGGAARAAVRQVAG